MKYFSKRYLCCCIFSALSFSAFSQMHDFIPTQNAAFDEPIEQGWENFLSGSAYGETINTADVTEWYANGNNGRANWKITPSSEINTQAMEYGWTLSTQMRVKSGGYLANYYANGNVRFLPIISLRNDQLIVEFEGVEGHTVLATGKKALEYHNYDIVFHPGVEPTASFYFDDQLIKRNWSPVSTSQNMIVWGNGSTEINAEAFYRSVKFTVSGDPVFSSPDRIPSLVVSKKTPGTVVIFAEKRVGGGDPGSILNTNDIVSRTSRDYGKSWSKEINLTEQINLSDDYDFSDPRPIYRFDDDEVIVSYVRWPTDAAQNGDKIKYWMESGVFYSTYDVVNNRWSAPFDVSKDIKEKSFQIVGWSGNESYSKAASLNGADEWELYAKLKISNGKANDLSISNGTKLFKVEFEISNENKLIAHLGNNSSPYVIRENGDNIAGFIDVKIRYNKEKYNAILYVDDKFIDTFEGSPSSDNKVLFGQTDPNVDGRMHLAYIKLMKNGQTALEYDPQALSLINPSEQNTLPETLGWEKFHSGRAYSFYGVASVNPGPGHGIQLEKQTYKAGHKNNRLIYPAITLDKYFLNVSSVFSDDKGVTWDVGAPLPVPYRWMSDYLETLEPSEADIVELKNGDLLLTARLDFNQTVNNVNYGARHQFISKDAGITWSMPENYGADQFLNMSIDTVDAAITRFSEQDDGNEMSYLLFTNPIGSLPGNAGRNHLGLWFSFDEGASWQGPVQLVNGGSAYSDIYQLDNKNAMVILEDNAGKIRTLTVPVSKLKQLVQPQ